MTLPLDVPTAKPPADLAPATAPALPPPTGAVIPSPAAAADKFAGDPLAEMVGPALLDALRQADPHTYFAMLLRTDPRLFHKWASLLMGRNGGGNATQNIINVVTAIPRSPLDELPKGFSING